MIQNLSSSMNRKKICLDDHSSLNHTICHDCLGEILKNWSKNKPGSVRRIINLELSKFEGLDVKGEKCLDCNKEKTIICPYCLMDILYEKLKEKTNNTAVLSSFLELF